MGRDGWRRPKHRTYGRSKHRRLCRLSLIITACSMLLVAVGLLLNYIFQERSVRDMQRELRASQTLATAYQDIPANEQDQAPVTTPYSSSTPVPVVTPYPLPISGAAMRSEFVSFFHKNNDLVGWLKSDAFYDIDFPIVKRDNAYYFDRDFYGRRNMAGTVFLDADNSILPQDQNLILHGHNMKNGTMFGKLARLLQKSILLSNPFFRFSTLYDAQVYVPYAVSLVSIEPTNLRYFHIFTPRFDNDERRVNYVEALRRFSSFNLPVQVSSNDRMLTLVTCHGDETNERLVIALRALRPDETEAGMRELLVRQTH